MNAHELLGAAATILLQRQLDGADGQVRVRLDGLAPDHLRAVCESITRHSLLASKCRVLIYRPIGERAGLPEALLTDQRLTYWRNRTDPEQRAFVLEDDDDEQRQSAQQVPSIGSKALLAEPALWVEAANANLTPDESRIWVAALKGLFGAAKTPNLARFAEYVAATRRALHDVGMPLEQALGHALPCLEMPRDSAYFAGFTESARGNTAAWRQAYQQAWRKRGVYLTKRHPTEQPIANKDLRENFLKVRESIDERLHAVFEAFIAAPATWGADVRSLAELEWEGDNVRVLFEGLKRKKAKIGQGTLELFEDKLPNELSAEERSYLERLDARTARDVSREDEEFYERHRDHLALDPRVKVAWDRMVFGKAIECDDLRAGLLQAMRQLHGQITDAELGRDLIVECHRQNATQWKETNKYAAHYFARRYKGLPALFGSMVEWKPATLFDDAAVEADSKKAGDRTSAAKTANEVKFTVRLRRRFGDEEASVQVIWRFDPNSILVAYAADWKLVTKHPFAAVAVTQETVSAKGRLQSISLRDVQTFMSQGSQLRGSLLSRKEQDAVDKRVRAALATSLRSGEVSREGHETIAAKWEAFASAYARAIAGYEAQGTASRALLDVEAPYSALLDALCAHARNDKACGTLWRPVADLGVAYVEEGDGAAIVAPWHPLRLVASAVADRRLGGLVRYLLREPDVQFGEPGLFFRDMAAELARPFYPEVCVGFRGNDPLVLATTDALGEYTLMECATRRVGRDDGRDETHEDPREAAKVLREVVDRFLALYPHEAANLSVVLFNCDSVGLPEAAVATLGEMNGDDEDRPVRCHVQLRHDSPVKLRKLYEALLEASARDSESGVASEATRDFMARLRVGIMATRAESGASADGPSSDIVFLQDVIARMCSEHWVSQPETMVVEDAMSHVPVRWSRHRPSMQTDLHSTTDLCCPAQTPSGWSYLRFVRGLQRGEMAAPEERPLPVRRVRFNEDRARNILETAHRIGQWVVNYDPILTRQHLRNLDVRVIRHRRAADGDRGVIVSSTASLNMLHMLVKRSLQSLVLDLPQNELGTLASSLVEYASEVSGDIVLRAARRSAFAHELIGVALSRFLLDDELGEREGELARGWYFLDDYAEWLGQREGHIADMLGLSVKRDATGRAKLVALVGEAKYITADNLSTLRAHSVRQTEQTIGRMRSALFDTPQRLDRDQWLARLADLLAQGTIWTETSREALQSAQREIAAGRMEIELRGYSHVFVHAKTPDDEVSSERESVGAGNDVWRETFAPDVVRLLLRAFHRHESPRAIRGRISAEHPWTQSDARRPAEGANWATSLASIDFEVPDVIPTVDGPKAKAGAGGKSAAKPGKTSISTTSPVVVTRPTKAGGTEKPLANIPTVVPAAAKQNTPTVKVDAPVIIADPPERSDHVEPPLPVATPEALFPWATPSVAAVLATALPEETASDDDVEWLDEVAARMSGALRSYKLQAKLLDKRLTPNVALLRFQGSDLLTVQSVEQQRGKLLTTHALKVQRISAEPGAIVLAIARQKRQFVSLPSVLRRRELEVSSPRRNTKLIIGVRESDGSTLYLDPVNRDAPHTLIAGTTGSGKSVLIQNLILDVAMTNAVGEAAVTIIDPKQGVDYQGLEHLPHLDGEIIVEQEAAIARLEALADEMDARYRLFREAGGVANLAGFNRKAKPEERLPVRWVVHDEFADWMLVDEYKAAVSKVVQRLGVKARAAGIHLIFAAQRPEERVMPMQLRDNLGNRLVLRVESEGTSRIALTEEGAERLLGKGQVAAKLQSEEGIVLAQVPILASELLPQIVSALRTDAAS